MTVPQIKNDFSCIALILNWNEIDQTVRSVRSLYAQTNVNLDIIVVDNHSEQDPTEILRSEFPNILVIINPKNYGVAGGRNVGIKYSLEKKYSFILLFDNDAVASPDMLENLLDGVKKDPTVGIFGPKILILENPKFIWRAGCYSWKWTYLFSFADVIYRFCRFFNKNPPNYIDKTNGYGQFDDGQFDKEKEISFQIGCAQLIRNDVFKEVGLLDDEFSPYGSEDIDFCARVSHAGWKIRYIPTAYCWHRDSSSFNDTYSRTYFNSRNLLLLARKNLPPLFFIFIFLPDYIFLTIPFMLIRTIMKKEPLRRRALYHSILWNLKDIKRQGLFKK